MDLHCRSTYSEILQAGEIANPQMLTLLSEHDGKLVGFAQLRWDGVPACVSAETPGGIQRLYVIADWHGKGVAQDLMQACLGEMSTRGCDMVWLGVWEHNPRAISFYRKFGFREVGDLVFPLGRDPQRDIVMARALAGQSTDRRPGQK